MKATIDGKRYNSEKCETLAEHNCHNNYSVTRYLLRASDGALLVHTDSDGQDCWRTDSLVHVKDQGYSADPINDFLESCELDEDQEKRLVELGLLTIVE